VGGTKSPDVEAIRALAPDLVYVNLEENLRRHGEAIASFASVFATEPKSVADVLALIEMLGAIHGVESNAAEFCDRIRDVMHSMQSRRFTFACPIWKDPWMWCGGDTYVSDLIRVAGGSNVLAERTRYPSIELEDVLALRPDLIFLPDEPFVFTGEHAALMTGTEVIGPFEGHLFTWHGTRTLLGLKFLQRGLR
jgi:ABC-type Fe3+-hydroxamate transport system substrate-binding protein